MALPLPIRNRLTDLILSAFDATGSKEVVEALDAFCRGEPTGRLLTLGFFDRSPDGTVRLSPWAQSHRAAICERVRAYREVLTRAERLRPEEASDPMIRAALLFETGCYFEVHEILEPAWMRAEGPRRQALQGLIQVAVGFQHLANGNISGARLLLEEGRERLKANGRALNLSPACVDGVTRCVVEIAALGPRAAVDFDWSLVPPWPIQASCHPW